MAIYFWLNVSIVVGAVACVVRLVSNTMITAEFIGYQEHPRKPSFPLYNIKGGSNNGTTVSAATLKELGIAIPHTPEKVMRSIKTSRNITMQEKLDMATAMLEHDFGCVWEDSDTEQYRGFVDDALIAVWEEYVSDTPGYIGKVIVAVFGAGPKCVMSFVERDDKIEIEQDFDYMFPRPGKIESSVSTEGQG